MTRYGRSLLFQDNVTKLGEYKRNTLYIPWSRCLLLLYYVHQRDHQGRWGQRVYYVLALLQQLPKILEAANKSKASEDYLFLVFFSTLRLFGDYRYLA